MTDRRTFIAGIAGNLLAVPLAVKAQEKKKRPPGASAQKRRSAPPALVTLDKIVAGHFHKLTQPNTGRYANGIR